VKPRHVVLTSGRSGSNFLVSLINSHPNVINYGEVLGEWNVIAKLHQKIIFGRKPNYRYLELILSSRVVFLAAQIYAICSRAWHGEKLNIKRWNNIETIGIKDFSFLFFRYELEEFFSRNPSIKVISLILKNQLKRLVSMKLMQETGVVASHRGINKQGEQRTKTRNKIFLDLSNLMAELDVFEREAEEYSRLLSTVKEENRLELLYENIFGLEGGSKSAQLAMQDFLKLERVDLVEKHQKLNSDKLSDLVENYDQLAILLKNTQYGKYLDIPTYD
jgi:hypothetical protein